MSERKTRTYGLVLLALQGTATCVAACWLLNSIDLINFGGSTRTVSYETATMLRVQSCLASAIGSLFGIKALRGLGKKPRVVCHILLLILAAMIFVTLR